MACVAVYSSRQPPLHLSPEEFASGGDRQEVTYIPLVEAVATLPYDNYEWYVLRYQWPQHPFSSRVD